MLVTNLLFHEQHISLQGEVSFLFGNISNLKSKLPKHLSTIEGVAPLFNRGLDKFLIEGGKVGCYPILSLIIFLCDSCMNPSRPSVLAML
jgi:hypothetical protein